MSTDLGREGEDLAVRLLSGDGYRILARNYRTRFGEIDVVAKKSRILVFVEVKYHSNLGFGEPYERVTSKKINKIKKTAEAYLFEEKLNCDWRVDVISIEKSTKKYQIFENVLTPGLS